MNRIIKKIDSIKEKSTMNMLRELVINEYKKVYYNNPDNIKEKIDLGTEVIGTEEKDYVTCTKYHVRNVEIYDNGMPIFNDRYLNSYCLSESVQKTDNKKKSKKLLYNKK